MVVGRRVGASDVEETKETSCCGGAQSNRQWHWQIIIFILIVIVIVFVIVVVDLEMCDDLVYKRKVVHCPVLCIIM